MDTSTVVELQDLVKKGKGDKKASFKCFNCERKGHYTRDCWSAKAEGVSRALRKQHTPVKKNRRGKQTVYIAEHGPTADKRNSDNEEYNKNEVELEYNSWAESKEERADLDQSVELEEQDDFRILRLDYR
jgi:hypothetical protein